MYWCGLLVISITLIDGPLSAQSLDTMRFESGDIRYMVFQRDKNGAATGVKRYFREGGILHSSLEQKEGKILGTSRYYYPNGQLWLEMPFKEGQMHGVVRTYHPNGRIQAVKPYKNGKLHGGRSITDSTGMPANGAYVELLPYDSAEVLQTCVNGLPHGLVVVKRAGHKVLEGNCVNGLAEGAFVISDKSGTVVRRDYYRKGKFKRSEDISPKKGYGYE